MPKKKGEQKVHMRTALKQKQKSDIKLKDAIDLFIDEKEAQNLSEATIRYYRDNLKRFMTCLNVEIGMSEPICEEFNAALIQKYGKIIKEKMKWKDHPDPVRQKDEKKSKNTYRTYLNAVRVFGNWLYRNGYIEEDILNSVKLPKRQQTMPKLLTNDEIKKIFMQFDTKTEIGLRNWLIVRLALDMGLREKSIATLKLASIDFERGTILVWLKGDKYNMYPIDKVLKEKLRKYLLLYRNKKETASKNLFLNQDGSEITTNTIRQMFKRLKQKTGIKELGCHMLRHNFATNYVLMGHNSEELKYMLGHTTSKMSEHYVHLANNVRLMNAGHDSYLNKINVK